MAAAVASIMLIMYEGMSRLAPGTRLIHFFAGYLPLFFFFFLNNLMALAPVG